jgi:cytochrome c553
MKISLTLAAMLSIAAMASIGVALALPARAAGNAETAKGKVSMCIGCHGIPQYHTAYPEVYHVPKIAGQSAEYIVRALQAYKNGGRNHPSMVGIARGLTEADMVELASYYGKVR